MTRMDAKLRVRVRMEDRGVPPFQTIVKSLRPTETLVIVPVRRVTPLPIRIAAENDRTRIVAAPNPSLGETLAQEFRTFGDMKTLNPEWSVMLSH